jgi:Amt family ammonium transporter
VGWFGFNVMSAQRWRHLGPGGDELADGHGRRHAGGTRGRRNDPGFVHNGPLAGLVAVCAGSDLMHPLGALVVGGGAGGLFVVMFTLTQNRWKIDDVLGVWPLHGLCGAWGGIAAGIFGSEALGGLGGGGLIVYGALKAFVGIRLDAEDEFNGTDLTIHKISASAERETLVTAISALAAATRSAGKSRPWTSAPPDPRQRIRWQASAWSDESGSRPECRISHAAAKSY